LRRRPIRRRMFFSPVALWALVGLAVVVAVVILLILR
jgi:hypothetical protein